MGGQPGHGGWPAVAGKGHSLRGAGSGPGFSPAFFPVPGETEPGQREAQEVHNVLLKKVRLQLKVSFNWLGGVLATGAESDLPAGGLGWIPPLSPFPPLMVTSKQ